MWSSVEVYVSHTKTPIYNTGAQIITTGFCLHIFVFWFIFQFKSCWVILWHGFHPEDTTIEPAQLSYFPERCRGYVSWNKHRMISSGSTNFLSGCLRTKNIPPETCNLDHLFCKHRTSSLNVYTPKTWCVILAPSVDSAVGITWMIKYKECKMND